METTRFDEISKLFSLRRLTRRRAMQQGAAGLAAAGLAAAGLKVAAAQDGTPAAEGTPAAGEALTAEFLFVQSFESGTIAPKDGADGAYTVTLQHGLGQTLYFSDRPERIVGASPTAQFLDGLGFSPDNPPNAALVVDSGDGGVDIAVVELTNPTYDASSFTATYDLSVLENFASDGGMQLQEETSDLAAISASFGSAHLFIDDCADRLVTCQHFNGQRFVTEDGSRSLGNQGFCYNWGAIRCDECDPYALKQACYDMFPDFCNDQHDCEPVAAP